ncbi:unnamed protein product [Parnassius mnemosyne]|uniref:Uncharacterized protein n=1 Tax=Parnassius mnemosyne TaxID=213953 RepID=A0AAV1L4E4_9NEOP
MAAIFYVYLILIGGFCVRALETIKAFYCQDPDTGKLYPVNSTWPSQTFCGNYTCKLRRKNITGAEDSPIRKVNITNININFLENEGDMSPSPSQIVNMGRIIDQEMGQLLQKENILSKTGPSEEKQIESNKYVNEGDRYLTDSEIKTISDMLHTVKKSDLEAIVDIYNLAQDIYKEMDKDTIETVIQETKTPIHTQNKVDMKQGTPTKDKQQISYWYEPLQYQNAKSKPENDMNDEGTTLSTTTVQTTKNKSNPNTFFKGSLTEKDFRKLPYYYPISNFQRVSSYTHPGKHNIQQNTASKHKPCKKPISNSNYVLPPWINKSLKNTYKPESSQNSLEPSSLLLPFPFAYVNSNNLSGYPPNFYYSGYSGYPWAQLNVYNRNRNYQQSYLGTAYIAQLPGESIYAKPEITNKYEYHSNSITKEDIIDIITSMKSKDIKKMPDWQTDPLPTQVIEEVRGNAEKSKLLKPYPLRKKVKLEKVGKVIKLDETVKSKRSVTENKTEEEEDDEFEAYVVKTTCEPGTELGYFRRGNMSRPFPACCPERIER